MKFNFFLCVKILFVVSLLMMCEAKPDKKIFMYLPSTEPDLIS